MTSDNLQIKWALDLIPQAKTAKEDMPFDDSSLFNKETNEKLNFCYQMKMAIIGNCVSILVLSSALPVMSRTLACKEPRH
ncbi:hypothetical protein JD844_003510 [Phrynosoma platyrhinos]|uniref:Uncharacterized protein n=1 Tax=Phrynosoma platyrhinos TaxID=52577 RepID=A0ABQ7TEM2_PHRPL|nr:hypothetical protein JD844_003510 [Phrynosoma platyrhinos]